MRHVHTIKSGDFTFVLEFSFSADYQLRPDTKDLEVVRHQRLSGVEESKYLEILVYRKDKIKQTLHAVHIVGSEMNIPIQLEFPNGHNIDGRLSLVQNNVTGQSLIWIDALCGPEDTPLHFIGTLAPLP